MRNSTCGPGATLLASSLALILLLFLTNLSSPAAAEGLGASHGTGEGALLDTGVGLRPYMSDVLLHPRTVHEFWRT